MVCLKTSSLIFVHMEKEVKPLSKSTKFNILFMKRTNRVAIFMFVAGILYKIIDWVFLK